MCSCMAGEDLSIYTTLPVAFIDDFLRKSLWYPTLIKCLQTFASVELHQWSNQLKLTKDDQPTLVVIYDKLLVTRLFLLLVIRKLVNWGYQATLFCDVLALELPG